MPYGSNALTPEVQQQLLGSGMRTHPMPAMAESPSRDQVVQLAGNAIASLKRALDQGDLQRQAAGPVADERYTAAQDKNLAQKKLNQQFSGYNQRDLDRVRSALQQNMLPSQYDPQLVKNAWLRRQQELDRGRQ